MGNLLHNDIGIDLGTSSILIYRRGKGIVLREPSIAAVERSGGRIVALGEDARRMIGHTPEDVTIIRPMREGVISNFDITARMLHTFIRKVSGTHTFFRPRALICVPSSVSEVEKRCIVEAALEAGARFCYLIQEPVAAAIGEDLDFLSASGHMVVDIGGGTSDLAVISSGSIVLSDSLRVAGDAMDRSILNYLAETHSLYIGEKAGEDTKWVHGRAWPGEDGSIVNLQGRSAVTGEPVQVPIGSNEFIDATKEPVGVIVERIRQLYSRLPSALAQDIAREGILLTGGGSLLGGLDACVSAAVGIPCRVAEDPLTSVVRGLGKVLEHFEVYKGAVYTYRRGDYLED